MGPPSCIFDPCLSNHSSSCSTLVAVAVCDGPDSSKRMEPCLSNVVDSYSRLGDDTRLCIAQGLLSSTALDESWPMSGAIAIPLVGVLRVAACVIGRRSTLRR